MTPGRREAAIREKARDGLAVSRIIASAISGRF